MKVSVALASYNGARFIGEQLRSLAAQTRHPDELIVTDDGSNDETVRIITDFARIAPFDVRLLQNPQRLGFGQNFGKALALCTGDIAFLCDQDDSWFPQKIERIVKLAQSMPKMQLFTNDAIIADIDLRPTAFTLLGQLNTLGRSRDSILTGCCIAMKRDLLQLCLPIPNGVNAHDIWVSKMAEKCATKFVLDQPLQYYRRHDKNATQNMTCLPRKITRRDRFKARLAAYISATRSVFRKKQGTAEVGNFENWLRIRLAQGTLTQSKHKAVVDKDVLSEIRDSVLRTRLRRYVRSLPPSKRPLAICVLLRRDVYATSRLRRCLRDLLG